MDLCLFLVVLSIGSDIVRFLFTHGILNLVVCELELAESLSVFVWNIFFNLNIRFEVHASDLHQ